MSIANFEVSLVKKNDWREHIRKIGERNDEEKQCMWNVAMMV